MTHLVQVRALADGPSSAKAPRCHPRARSSDFWRSLICQAIRAPVFVLAEIATDALALHDRVAEVLDSLAQELHARLFDTPPTSDEVAACLVDCAIDIPELPLAPLRNLQIVAASPSPTWDFHASQLLTAWLADYRHLAQATTKAPALDSALPLLFRRSVSSTCPQYLTWSLASDRHQPLRPMLIKSSTDHAPERFATLSLDTLLGSGTIECGIAELLRQLERLINPSFYAEISDTPNGPLLTEIARPAACRAADARQLCASNNRSTIDLKLLDNLPPHELIASVNRLTGTRSDMHELARTQPSGGLIVSGRVATRLEDIDSLIGSGDPIVLFLPKLPPAEAHVLPRLHGIVLRDDGPSSHSVIMAHSANVAVLPGTQFVPSHRSILVQAKQLNIGDWVTLHEPEGALYLGRTSSSESNLAPISATLAAQSAVHILANASAPSHVAAARRYGARGIGLCRSESQVFESEHVSELESFVKAALFGSTPALPHLVCAHLQKSLAALLEAAAGLPIHYRLIDANIDELAPSFGLSNIRGPRWALHSGFYDWQIAMCVAMVAHRAKGGFPSDVVIVIPSVSTPPELDRCRQAFNLALNTTPVDAPGHVRLGCMIETPRAVALAAPLAQMVDVVCIGLNDLTASCWAVPRAGWQILADVYATSEVILEDPLVTIDEKGLGGDLQRLIQTIRTANPYCRINVCGEHTNDSDSCAFLGALGVDSVTCHATSLLSAASGLLLAQQRKAPATETSTLPTASPIAAATGHAQTQALRALRRDDHARAQQVAYQWATRTANHLNIPFAGNWKIFKRDLVARFFGKLDTRRFSPGWSVDDVVTHIKSIRQTGKTPRYSVFPNAISCHSKSFAIVRTETDAQIRGALSVQSNDDLLEVFPQQDPNQLCFRATFNPQHESIEAGWGQAMYVFEAERGQHPIARADYDPATGSWCTPAFSADTPAHITDGLMALLTTHGQRLRLSAQHIAFSLGVQWMALEGYFNPSTLAVPTIVDLDLPMDIVWNSPAHPARLDGNSTDSNTEVTSL